MRRIASGACAAAMVALLSAAGSVPAQAPAPDGRCGTALDARHRVEVDGAQHRLAFVPVPAPLASGRHLSLDIVVCPRLGASAPGALKVDADMPAHRHGMNYRPLAVPQGSGRFRVDGLMFHMPGRWRLMLEVETPDGPRRLEQPVEVR